MAAKNVRLPSHFLEVRLSSFELDARKHGCRHRARAAGFELELNAWKHGGERRGRDRAQRLPPSHETSGCRHRSLSWTLGAAELDAAELNAFENFAAGLIGRVGTNKRAHSACLPLMLAAVLESRIIRSYARGAERTGWDKGR